jgi:hypothetical protein
MAFAFLSPELLPQTFSTQDADAAFHGVRVIAPTLSTELSQK